MKKILFITLFITTMLLTGSVAGYEENAQKKSVAELRKNGKAQDITDGTKHAGAYSVFVK